jgi:hypothetical protein
MPEDCRPGPLRVGKLERCRVNRLTELTREVPRPVVRLSESLTGVCLTISERTELRRRGIVAFATGHIKGKMVNKLGCKFWQLRLHYRSVAEGATLTRRSDYLLFELFTASEKDSPCH